MATTPQKKKPAASGGKRTASSSTRSGGSKKAPPPSSKPIRREVGAAVCLFLALFAALGYFGLDGFFITFLSDLIKGLVGYGYWLAPPALLLSAYILAFHRGRPVRLRLCCALLLPLLFGSILHLFFVGRELWQTAYPWAWESFQALWVDGIALKCGGVVSGFLCQALAVVFHPIGAGILLIPLALLAALWAFNRSIMDLVHWFQGREHPDYEPYEEPEYEEPVDEPEPTRKPRRPVTPPLSPAEVDIPLDGEVKKAPAKVHVELDEPPKKKRGLFSRDRAVPTPAEFLTGEASKPPVKEAAPAHPFDMPDPGPAPGATLPDWDDVPDAQDTFEDKAPAKAPSPAAKTDPAIAKVTKEEAAQATAEVTAEIAEALDQSAPVAYQYPPVSLLTQSDGVTDDQALGELKRNQDRLADTIRSFGVEANIVNVVRGPSVTRYEMELDQGVKLSRVTNLADDIALALGAEAVRIAPIPDKISTVGIEVPNKLVSTVHIHDVLDDAAFRNHSSKVAFAVGKDIGGNAIIGNIARLPHLLIAGTTGSGKSVCTNSLIISLLYKATPDEVRLIMVDPKMVELGVYNGIPHLLIPVVTDPKKAAGALQWAVTEMMKRYRTFADMGVRKLEEYNAKAAKTEGMEKLPYVVVLIDELADLMLVAAKEVEESICRVAQMGRAAGMHLVIATQRPSADVITGLMKANIPSRIAFAVSSSLESRIILDTTGAEKLVGKGDMLWNPLGAQKPLRVQGCFVTDEEVEAVVDFVKQSGAAEYDETVMAEIDRNAQEKEKAAKGIGGSAPGEDGGDEGYDELLPAAIEVVVELGQASVSMLQRRLKLGYGRAARLVDQMEEKGVVGPFEGSKPRQVLVTKEQWQEMQYRQGMAPAPDGGLPTPEEDDEAEALPDLDDAPPFDLDEDDN